MMDFDLHLSIIMVLYKDLNTSSATVVKENEAQSFILYIFTHLHSLQTEQHTTSAILRLLIKIKNTPHDVAYAVTVIRVLYKYFI